MKNICFLLLFIMATLFGSTSAWADETAKKTIDWLKIRSDSGLYFLVKDSGWGGPDCPNATHAYIDSSANSHSDQLLSVAIAAKLSKSIVKLEGTCVGDIYFIITIISVH